MKNQENQQLIREILCQAKFETDNGLRRTCFRVKCSLVFLLIAVLCLSAYVYKAERDIQVRLESSNNALKR